MLSNSGYHSCPCRDCFLIAIGCDDDNTPHLCSDCEDSGCVEDSECQNPCAYDGCDNPDCCDPEVA